MGMAPRRAALVPALTAGCVLVLSSCTVPEYGTLGILRADDGGLVAVVQMCSHHVDGVTVYESDTPDDGVYPFQGAFDDAVTDLGRLALPADFEGGLARDVSYDVYAWSKDNSASARGPEFTEADLETLDAGQVLIQVSRDETWVLERHTEDEFVELVKGSCPE